VVPDHFKFTYQEELRNLKAESVINIYSIIKSLLKDEEPKNDLLESLESFLISAGEIDGQSKEKELLLEELNHKLLEYLVKIEKD
jgi:hypothetical protein